jgi:hypothetical protein
MSPILRAVLASSLFVSSVSFAQDAEVNMNVQVDDADMPSTSIKIRASDTGGGANMEVKVKGGTTRTESHSERHTRHEERSGMDNDSDNDTVPVRAVASEPAFRDCGTREDEGCTLRRDGQLPMDAKTFRGFLQALKGTGNELTREEMAEKMLKKNYLTAVQFGLVLDLFQNELTRLDVAKNAAPHVVNPQHALGFASKWNNSITGSEYTELISAQ